MATARLLATALAPAAVPTTGRGAAGPPATPVPWFAVPGPMACHTPGAFSRSGPHGFRYVVRPDHLV
jgi:hypothetical protein